MLRQEIQRVAQLDPTGCGIACVAMICGTTYAQTKTEAFKLLGWEASKRTFYTSSAELRALLQHRHIKSGQGKMIRKWSRLPDLAIVGINPNEKLGTWHWVIFFRKNSEPFVLDPRSKREVRTDFERMRLRSFIPVETSDR